MFSRKNNCFCAFCKIERKVTSQRDANWANVLLSILTAIFFQMFLFQTIDGRVLLLAVIFLFLSHVFIRIRWRLSMPCPHCGFDPVLYQTDKKEAVERVKYHLEALKKNGRYLLKTQNPFQTLTRRTTSTPLKKSKELVNHSSRSLDTPL